MVVARRGGPHPREEPVHAPRPVALEAEDAARVGDAVLLRGPRRRRRAANLDAAVDGRQVVVAQDARTVVRIAVPTFSCGRGAQPAAPKNNLSSIRHPGSTRDLDGIPHCVLASTTGGSHVDEEAS